MRLDHLLSKEKVRAVVYCSVTEVTRKYLVAMRPGDTPVPIPNTKVKTRAADGTALETVWESRWLPDFFKNKAERLLYIKNIIFMKMFI